MARIIDVKDTKTKEEDLKKKFEVEKDFLKKLKEDVEKPESMNDEDVVV